MLPTSHPSAFHPRQGNLQDYGLWDVSWNLRTMTSGMFRETSGLWPLGCFVKLQDYGLWDVSWNLRTMASGMFREPFRTIWPLGCFGNLLGLYGLWDVSWNRIMAPGMLLKLQDYGLWDASWNFRTMASGTLQTALNEINSGQSEVFSFQERI